MSLSALPSALLLPPVNLLALGGASLLLARRRRRAGLMLLTCCLGLLLLLAMPVVSDLMFVALENGLPLVAPGGDPPEAIVILSAEWARDTRSNALLPGPLTLERERAGAALARRTQLPVLVSGGIAGDGRDTLAGIMARSLAEDFLVPVRWQETASVDTWENAADSAAILRAQHIRSVYLVTHAWHMRRALIAFAHAGIVATASPVALDPWPDAEPEEFIPRASAWVASYYALHEWIGCADYAWFRSRDAGS